MKLLLDQGLPRSATSHLATLGIEAVHAGELGLARALDEIILEEARLRSAVVVTLDAVSHALLAVSGSVSPSVIRIRKEGLKGEQLAHLLAVVVTEPQEVLERGAVLSVDGQRIRVRALPLHQRGFEV